MNAKQLKLSLVVVAAALLSCAACDAGDTSTAREANSPGELYLRNCAVCHGPEGAGRQVGAVKAPAIREGRAAAYTDERLSRQIHEGGNGMPPFKDALTEEQIDRLVRFVREEIQKGSRQ